MKVSVSILSVKDDIKECVRNLSKTDVDYIHLDIMDGKFVSNRTWDIEEIKNIISNTNKPLDVHLMVEDLDEYINEYVTLNPKYITFHLEATKDVSKYISILRQHNINVGLSIKPNTDVSNIEPWLPFVDLVLVMSVEPGAGGQEFMYGSLEKIKKLNDLKTINNYDYAIQVDGGINSETVSLVREAGVDIVVSGSYIVNDKNYQYNIDALRK